MKRWAVYLVLSLFATKGLASSGAKVTDPDSCASLLPLLDGGVDKKQVDQLYSFHAKHQGWSVDADGYTLSPSETKTYTINVAVSGPAGSAVQVNTAVTCNLPTHWQAKNHSTVALRVPSSLYNYPGTHPVESGITPQWNAFAGLITNLVGSYSSDLGWFWQIAGDGNKGNASDLQSEFGYLGPIDIAPGLDTLPTDALIAFKIEVSGLAATDTWAVRSARAANGQTLPAWSDSIETEATQMLAKPLVAINVNAPQSLLSAHGALDVAGLDLVDAEGSSYAYSSQYCGSVVCSLDGYIAINQFIGDRVKAGQQAQGSLQATLVFALGSGLYGLGTYSFDPTQGFTVKDFETFPTLEVKNFSWLRQYRSDQGLQ